MPSCIKPLKLITKSVFWPKLLTNESINKFSLKIYGCDDEGNSLLINMNKQKNRNDEVWLILRLANGKVFTLPGV